MVAKKRQKAHGSILGPARPSSAVFKQAAAAGKAPEQRTAGVTKQGQNGLRTAQGIGEKAGTRDKQPSASIDRTTGKKRGTLFSAAPAARKPHAKKFATVAPPGDAHSGKVHGVATRKGQNHDRPKNGNGGVHADGGTVGKRKRYRGKAKKLDMAVRFFARSCSIASL